MAISFNKEPFLLSSVKNPIGILINADPIWNTYDDYYLKLIVEVENTYRSGTFTALNLDLRGFPNAAGATVEFNLSRALNMILSGERPVWTNTNPTIGQNANKRYQYTIEEYIDGSLNSSLNSSIKHVIRAGFHYTNGQYMQQYVNGLKWLTHQPRTKKSTRHAAEFLYYIHVGANTTLELFADLIFEDDTSQIGFQPNLSISVETGDLVLFPVSYKALGLDQFVTPPVKSYEIYLGASLSEKMKFEIDCTYYPNERFYLFENSLGGYDTVRVTGRLREGNLTESQQAEKSLGAFYDPSFPQVIQTQTVHKSSFSQHTGILELEGVRWMKGMLISEDAIRIGGPGVNHFATGEYWPITIDRGENNIREDDNFLYGIAFNYSDAFNNTGI